MCLGVGQGQARKGVQVRCDFRQQLEIGEKICKKFYKYVYLSLSLCGCAVACVWVPTCVWRLEDNHKSQTSLSTFGAGSFARLGDRRY